MARPLLGLLVWLWATSQALALEFHHYHSASEIEAYLGDMAQAQPELVHRHRLGRSEQGRPIDYVVLSQGDYSHRPALYLNGTHHGDERASTETVLGLIDFLVVNRDTQTVKELLNNYAVYLQPVVNPDGFALGTRFDGAGIDPNRDYAYPGRSAEESFKTRPIRLIKELTGRVHFRAAIAFHAGMEGVLWAWAHTADKAPDHDLYYTLAKLTASAMGMPRYVQSYQDYPALGEFIDYVYMTHQTLALTVEVANEPSPPPSELPSVVRRAVGGSMAFMLGILDLDRGQLLVEHPSRGVSGFSQLPVKTASAEALRGRPNASLSR